MSKPTNNMTEQLSLFPEADNLELLIAESKHQLPITDENQLIQLIYKVQNTTLKQLDSTY